MEIIISTSFNYGGWRISFEKGFNWRFAPFFGMSVVDCNSEGYENVVELANDEYRSTIIDYDSTEGTFTVHVSNTWRRPVSDETLDTMLESFSTTGWMRTDATDIDKLKALMKKDLNE